MINILSRDLKINKNSKDNFIVTVLSNDGNVDKKVRVNIRLTNPLGQTKLYELTSDDEGLVKLPINLAFPGEYTITTYYKSDELVNKLTIVETNVAEEIKPNTVNSIAGKNPAGKTFTKEEINNVASFIQKFIKNNNGLPSSVQMKAREDNKVYEITSQYYAGLFEQRNVYILKHGVEPNYVTLNVIANNPLVIDYQNNKYNCCPTSLSMAIQCLYGNVSESQCAKTLGTSTNGTGPNDLVNNASKLGYKVTRINRNSSEVRNALSKGLPVITHYQTGQTKSCKGLYSGVYGHYSLIYGITDTQYKVADPTKGFCTYSFSCMDNANNGYPQYYYVVSPL